MVSVGAEEDIRSVLHDIEMLQLISSRGAYCSMTIISILNLPLELPPGAPARAAGLNTFTDRLPEWLSRCSY